MTHFATPLGAYPFAEHELAAVIDTETAICRILGHLSLSRPPKDQQYVIALIAPPASSIDTHEQWSR